MNNNKIDEIDPEEIDWEDATGLIAFNEFEEEHSKWRRCWRCRKCPCKKTNELRERAKELDVEIILNGCKNFINAYDENGRIIKITA